MSVPRHGLSPHELLLKRLGTMPDSYHDRRGQVAMDLPVHGCRRCGRGFYGQVVLETEAQPTDPRGICPACQEVSP